MTHREGDSPIFAAGTPVAVVTFSAPRKLGQSPCVLGLPARLHRDQRGTISIVSVFTALLLIMLLGMVMNVGRQVDGKIRMQNAADAATYTGGVVLARAMNTWPSPTTCSATSSR